MNIYKKPLYEVKKISDLRELLITSKETYKDKTAFLVKVDGQYMPVTYEKFYEDCISLATVFNEMGLEGKHIGVIGENSYQWAVTYLATVSMGSVIVPMDKELPKEETAPLIEIAELEAIVYSQKCEEIVADAKISHKINMEEEFNALLKKGKELRDKGDRFFEGVKIDADVMSILLFTSGTTSNSKAVMLSHKNIVTNIMGMCSMVYVDENDTLLSVLPIHHTYECTCGFLAPHYRGCTIAFCEGLRHIQKNLKESKATIMLCVPLLADTLYKRVMQGIKKKGKEDTVKKAMKISNFLLKFGIDIRRKLFSEIHDNIGGKLARLVCGAAATDPVTAAGMRSLGIDVIQGYGLTECAPICAVNRFEHYRDAAAGLPMPGMDIIIDNPDEDGIGEILVKGDNVMLGYYKNPEATAEVFKNGYFRTGDLGYLDKNNFLYITGRQKNVIVTKNGKNIFPEELETYLGRSPYISESMVYGVDNENGDTDIYVQIVPSYEDIEEMNGGPMGTEAVQKLIEEEVLKVNHTLQNFKRISKVIIRHEEFVKTTTKKIKRHMALKENEK